MFLSYLKVDLPVAYRGENYYKVIYICHGIDDDGGGGGGGDGGGAGIKGAGGDAYG